PGLIVLQEESNAKKNMKQKNGKKTDFEERDKDAQGVQFLSIGVESFTAKECGGDSHQVYKQEKGKHCSADRHENFLAD
ncbi:MAG: hypothetical protein MUO63_18580, partial [Desulfobulbaceae bacterium]|nr:hypothetical protein [Desulfobulbaceae bacterium]